MKEPVWIIEPRDPLIARDGRPFEPVPGARAESLTFPFPSTTTGGVRTRAGLNDQGWFEADAEKVKRIAVRGPLLVELDRDNGEIQDWLVPAPADAVLFAGEAESERAVCRRVVPLSPPEGTATNLPEGLVLLGIPGGERRKPLKDAPRFWYWDRFVNWLEKLDGKVEIAVSELGHGGPRRDWRMHVGIKPETQTADEERGALFRTRGLEFTTRPPGAGLESARRLALAVATSAPNLRQGLGPLGGERRLVCWRKSGESFPALSEGLKQRIVQSGHCRLVLLTPGYFTRGWKPTWLLEAREGVRPLLRAVAVSGYQVVSGWDLAENRPKPTRRLAPAGTVYFLRLEGEKRDVAQWVERMWFSCVSDDPQDRLDGFGLAVPGFWEGREYDWEVKSYAARA